MLPRSSLRAEIDALLGATDATSAAAALAMANAEELAALAADEPPPPVREWPSVREAVAAAASGDDAPASKRARGVQETLAVIKWAASIGVCPPDDSPDSVGDRLFRQARLRAVGAMDLGKLRSALAWAQDYVALTGEPFFTTLQHERDEASSERNWAALDGFAEFMRCAGSRAKGQSGRTLRADWIQTCVGLMRSLREEWTSTQVVFERRGASRLFKAMRREDGPPGQRESRRALRAAHFAMLLRSGEWQQL